MQYKSNSYVSERSTFLGRKDTKKTIVASEGGRKGEKRWYSEGIPVSYTQYIPATL
jgi:hypothetical protein